MCYKKFICLFSSAAILVALASCGKETAVVAGQFIGADRKPVILDAVSGSGQVPAQSSVTDPNGKFRIRVELPSGQTTFYNLKVNGSDIPLFISCGERIKIMGLYANPGGYRIEGSPESELVREITDILSDGAMRLDSLSRVSMAASGEAGRAANAKEYASEYQRIKRSHIKFIISNRDKLAAIYALNQRLPNDEFIFDNNNDIIYYREVAQHLEKTYPDSPYLAALKKEIENYDSVAALAGELMQKAENPDSFPEIEMPDKYGYMQKLSNRIGKVIILDFWSHEFEQAAAINAEYRELYDLFGRDGLEIFQVSVDDSRPEWIAAVQEQQLPWTTVFDSKGSGATAARQYNIAEIPANYLLGADGEIIGRNIFGERLREQVEAAVGKAE